MAPTPDRPPLTAVPLEPALRVQLLGAYGELLRAGGEKVRAVGQTEAALALARRALGAGPCPRSSRSPGSPPPATLRALPSSEPST